MLFHCFRVMADCPTFVFMSSTNWGDSRGHPQRDRQVDSLSPVKYENEEVCEASPLANSEGMEVTNSVVTLLLLSCIIGLMGMKTFNNFSRSNTLFISSWNGEVEPAARFHLPIPGWTGGCIQAGCWFLLAVRMRASVIFFVCVCVCVWLWLEPK